jgi:hypothetical protein
MSDFGTTTYKTSIEKFPPFNGYVPMKEPVKQVWLFSGIRLMTLFIWVLEINMTGEYYRRHSMTIMAKKYEEVFYF